MSITSLHYDIQYNVAARKITEKTHTFKARIKALAVHNNCVFTHTAKSPIYCYDLITLKPKWASTADKTTKWVSPIFITAMADVGCCMNRNDICLFSLADGKILKRWTSLSHPIGLIGNRLIFPLWTVNLQDQTSEELPNLSRFTIVHNKLFVHDTGNIYDPETKQTTSLIPTSVNQVFENSRYLLAVKFDEQSHPNRIYTADLSKYPYTLHQLDISESLKYSHVYWRGNPETRTSNPIITAMTRKDDIVYVATGGGNLHSIGTKVHLVGKHSTDISHLAVSGGMLVSGSKCEKGHNGEVKFLDLSHGEKQWLQQKHATTDLNHLIYNEGKLVMADQEFLCMIDYTAPRPDYSFPAPQRTHSLEFPKEQKLEKTHSC